MNDSLIGIVVLLHGFGGYKEQAHLSKLAQELNHAGVAALRFDATGIGESDGEHPERFRLETYRRDIDACLDAVVTYEGVDPKSVGIWGHSLGGLLGVITAAEDTRVLSVCAVSPPHVAGQGVSAKTALELWQEQGWIVKFNPHHGMVRFPFSCMDGAASWNGIEAAGRLEVPLLVIAGNRDRVILDKESHQIAEAASNASFLCLGELDHGYMENAQQIDEVNQHVVQFFVSTLTFPR